LECVANWYCRFQIEYDKIYERAGHWGSRQTFCSSSKLDKYKQMEMRSGRFAKVGEE
jgi:hypothetical protein